MPFVSIITITYNAELYIEATILSVINQTSQDFEYIVIDGNSKDNTLNIIKKYKNHITKLVSEPDKGIYDAMNKGLAQAQGDFVWFMNAGDTIFEKNTLQNLRDMVEKNPQIDILYGDAWFINLQGKDLGKKSEITPMILPEHLSYKHFAMGLIVCHQAILVKKKIAPMYDLAHKYSADIDWVIKATKQAKSITNTHQTLTTYRQGGFSRKHLYNSLKDRYLILRKHYGFWANILNHAKILLRSVLFLVAKRKFY